MPQRQPGVPPPFDEGVFLMHFNRGRAAFEAGRIGEARRELELAQRYRPDDADVLNLLGLVYFKMNAYPDAEVIYRRLASGNPDVFILHSNLGLILFKQGKLEEAERYLLRSLELRPNHAKSHLYLGLLYRQRGRLRLALDHLKFAGAEKPAREVEGELKALGDAAGNIPPAISTALADELPREPLPRTTVEAPVVDFRTGEIAAPAAAVSSARKLQDVVDEDRAFLPDERMIDLGGRKIEGASKTFSLHENGFLEIDTRSSVYIKRGTVSSYSGNLRFAAESSLVGTTAQTLARATGQGKLFLYEKGRKTFLLDLNDEFIYVEGGNLLALEDSLAYRVEPIYDATYQRKIDTVKIFGRGSLAISTSIEPLTLRVTRELPLSISSNALVAWTGDLIPTVMDDDNQISNVMIDASDQVFQIRFEGEGVVVSES
jgi:tetratricopeptide (TPR) repeat protein